ncbi:hypothetical protein WR25_20650 [Diploscapter pachys]|uniref:G-protein coupled receptors family 1 profile domain-containing protein n=1 Tax=Diploscapter pachys TaxID=2018661 RepID=A0A2A2L2K4_9BILA|nr:hypothetical protein WR25_20650 [Diploscapter pachys]
MEDSGSSYYIYILLSIAMLGLSGNVISLVTIFHSRLRTVNANVYLIVLTTADSVFLIGVLLVCFKVDYISYEYCVGIEYIMNTASFISSWSTAALTIERYLAIVHPLRHIKYGHLDRVKIVCYYISIPVILQLWQFYSLRRSSYPEERKCELKDEYYQIIAQILDTILCYMLPCMTIVILNILVAVKLQRSAEKFGVQKVLSNGTCDSRRQGGSVSNQSNSWNRILWVMPLVFVILNTPFYVCMMWFVMLQVADKNDASHSPIFETAHNISHYLLYLNSAIDVLIYAFSSANFRKTVVIAWRNICCPNSAKAYSKPVTEQFSRPASFRHANCIDNRRLSVMTPSSQGRRTPDRLSTDVERHKLLDMPPSPKL